MTFAEVYSAHGETEYLNFDRIIFPLSDRPDLNAFMLLDSLFPGTSDIVSAAEHDEIFLSVTPDELSKVASKDTMIDLIRCGVRYDSSTDCLAMFV